MSVTGTVYSIDPTCPTKVESLTDEDCVVPNSPNTSITNIILACSVGGSIVIVIIITAVVISLWCAHRRKKLNLSR